MGTWGIIRSLVMMTHYDFLFYVHMSKPPDRRDPGCQGSNNNNNDKKLYLYITFHAVQSLYNRDITCTECFTSKRHKMNIKTETCCSWSETYGKWNWGTNWRRRASPCNCCCSAPPCRACDCSSPAHIKKEFILLCLMQIQQQNKTRQRLFSDFKLFV